jgi:homoserine dehydrogenase
MFKIGIVGVGTVGTSVIKILKENRDIIQARAGVELRVTKGVIRNTKKERGFPEVQFSTDPDDILNDPKIDIVVELMGGVDASLKVVTKALKNGKSVVTANKALLAYHRYELQELCGKNTLAYEASVAGGIPIIQALKNGLSANHIKSIRGIINGTSNYMLTKMTNEGVAFDVILKEAQDLGYAEADPTFDIGGFDAAHKLLILASIAYGIDAKPEDILIEGIENITQDDIAFAKEFGYAIKHLGIAKIEGKTVSLRVHPVLIDKNEMIAKIDGVMNGISVVGDRVGETMYYGPGAGGDATASAVIADLIDIARGSGSGPVFGFKKPLEEGLALGGKYDITSKYYFRFDVEDKIGVLEKIAATLAKYAISVETFLQKSVKPRKGENQPARANLLFSTHVAKEADVQAALKAIEALEFIKSKPSMIRIED